MNSLLNIGTDVEAVLKTKEAILEILNARADQETIRMALSVLQTGIQPQGTIVTNCHFSSATPNYQMETECGGVQDDTLEVERTTEIENGK